jgi:hypothetical protein
MYFLMLKSLILFGKVFIVFVCSLFAFHMYVCVVKIATNYYLLVIAFSWCCIKQKKFVCNFRHLFFVTN